MKILTELEKQFALLLIKNWIYYRKWTKDVICFDDKRSYKFDNRNFKLFNDFLILLVPFSDRDWDVFENDFFDFALETEKQPISSSEQAEKLLDFILGYEFE